MALGAGAGIFVAFGEGVKPRESLCGNPGRTPWGITLGARGFLHMVVPSAVLCLVLEGFAKTAGRHPPKVGRGFFLIVFYTY